jgi:hypothetical protein
LVGIRDAPASRDLTHGNPPQARGDEGWLAKCALGKTLLPSSCASAWAAPTVAGAWRTRKNPRARYAVDPVSVYTEQSASLKRLVLESSRHRSGSHVIYASVDDILSRNLDEYGGIEIMAVEFAEIQHKISTLGI